MIVEVGLEKLGGGVVGGDEVEKGVGIEAGAGVGE